jgi:hypothetical protein
MAVRLYVGIAVLATLAFLLYAAGRAGYFGPRSRPVPQTSLKPPPAAPGTAPGNAAPKNLSPAWLAARDEARTLGVSYRDQNRPREAAQYFALAVDTVRAVPPPETGAQRLALRADLFDLGVALEQLGLRRTALQAFGEAREYYLKTEPNHPALKEIDEKISRLQVIQSGNK